MEKALLQLQQSFQGELALNELYRSIYATDASVYRKLPLAVAFPKNTAAIKQLIAFANKHGTSLIPRTAGTSLAGQCVGEGIIVDVSRYFTEILSVDTINKTVTVQPGVIRDELNAFLAPYGLYFGPNTSTSNRCMIGGMVGNNSSGTTSIQYGVTRDKVLQLKTILSNGDEATFQALSKNEFIAKTRLPNLEGKIYSLLFSELSSETTKKAIKTQFPKPEIHRRNTGYAVDSLLDTEVFEENDKQINLSSLLCGSEGTLAFTTAITLQLDELPPEQSAMIVTHYHTLQDCLLDVVHAMKHQLFTCEMMDDVILERTQQNKKYEPYRFFVEGSPRALLLLEVRATNEKELSVQIEKLLGSLLTSKLSYAQPVLRNEEITMALELRKAGLGLLGNMVGDDKTVACIEDTAVALPDLPAYINEFTALMQSYDQKAVYYAHAGAGELHLRPILNLKKEQDVAFFRQITTDVAALVKKYRGSFSGEHGDGIVRAEFLESMIGTSNYNVLRRIKACFDPDNIFNPAKIVDAYKMDEDLRYVPGREEPKVDTLMRFNDSQGILRLAEKCNGSGDCRKSEAASGAMCPSYHATRDEKDTTRARANALREVLTNNKAANKFDSESLKEVFDLCISCKACATECPSNVDMATAKAEFLYQYKQVNGTSKSDAFFAKSSYYNKMASRIPGLANFLLSNRFSANLIKKWYGIASERSMPIISTKTFSNKHLTALNQFFIKQKKVILFIDEFSNYLDTVIAEDAYFLLSKLGYQVTAVQHLDSARALISKGYLEQAKQAVDKNLHELKDQVSTECPLLGIEPSAILGFRDEYLRLANNEKLARHVADNTFLVEEFLASEIAKGHITPNLFTSEAKAIKIHIHCHQKALSNSKVTFDLLNLPKHYKPTIIPSGCCGMAGSFGFEKEHYEVSMQMGALKLFPAVNKASEETIIAANGTSCRHQIKDGTGRVAMHPISILRQALL